MTAGNAILIVAIVTGLGLIGALFFVMFKIRQISREFFGTSSLIEGLKRQEALEDDTPKSVSGMTRVELPRIEKDFPEFHWPEWKQRCENQLKGYLEALEHRDLSYLGKVSVSLKDQVRLTIEEMEEHYPDAVVVAVDAAVGRWDHVGLVTLEKGPLRPGLGVRKELTAVGDISITGIVGGAESGDPLFLQSIRLSQVMRLADCISRSICLGLRIIGRRVENFSGQTVPF